MQNVRKRVCRLPISACTSVPNYVPMSDMDTILRTGAKYMSDDEAVQAGENNMRHSHATHDLFNHIGSGKEEVWVSHCCSPT